LLLFVLLALDSRPERAIAAHEPSCIFSMTSINFGTINVTLNTTFTTTGTFSATCTGNSGSDAGLIERICISFGAGTGGISGSGAPRFMTGGGNTLSYNLYQNVANTTVWGSWLSSADGGNGAELDITLDGSGNGSGSLTVYATINAGQQTVPPGNYTSTFSSAHVTTVYGLSSDGTCSNHGLPNSTTSPTFTVSAAISAACQVSPATLTFPTTAGTSLLSTAVTANTTVSVTCTNTSPYAVGMDQGSHYSSGNRMANGTTNFLPYGLYVNSSLTNPWTTAATNSSCTITGDCFLGTGTGLAQSIPIYGQVPTISTGPAPVPGTYSDTVVIKVTY
jgi:spore coat protein U-like protein